MKKALVGSGIFIYLIATAGRMKAAELKAETLTAWNKYLEVAQANMNARVTAGNGFLWVDEKPGRALHIRQGQIQVAPMDGRGSRRVPNGLIHHWIGATFIPDSSTPQVLGVVRDYSHYKQFYNPPVIDSRLITKSPDGDQFFIRWVNKALFVNAAVDAQCRFRWVQIDSRRTYSASYTAKLQEIQDYGRRGEHDLPPDQGNGFIWRLYSIARYEQRDGGVYLEIEAIALTRGIPGSLRMFMSPLVSKLSRRSLSVSLEQTRKAVRPEPKAADVSIPLSTFVIQ